MRSRTRIIRSPDQALAELERISKEFGKGPNGVKVGLPMGSNDYPDGTSVIMVGAVHEFGSPSKGIPERSFLRTTVVENKRSYKDLFKRLSRQIVNNQTSVKDSLGIIGLKVQTDVQDKIIDIDSPPLKYRQGNPLHHTGHLVQSITFEVDE